MVEAPDSPGAASLPDRDLFWARLKAADPARAAVVDLGLDPPATLTYGQLAEWTERAARGLAERGVRPGDHVAYILPNSWQFVVLTAAIWRLGASACPMLPAMREREVTFIAGRSKSRILVAPEEFHRFRYGPMLEAVRKDLPELKATVMVALGERPDFGTALGGLAGRPGDAALPRGYPPPGQVAQLLFTSGTTGEPKGVLHTFATLSYALRAHVEALGLTRDDRIWVPSPMAHQTGFLYGLMVALYLGAAQICQPAWHLETARLAIEAQGASFVQAAMPFLADLVRMERPPRGLRIFVATGAAVPRQLAREAGEALRCQVIGGWGSTEACLVTVGHALSKNEAHWKSDGRVLRGMEIRVTDPEGTALPPGREGIFRVKTPAMFVGYLDHPEWYRDAIDENGFCDTGDLALIDADGHLHLTGRRKDVINRGGEKIPAAELEDLLYQFDVVKHAAIVAMPDPRLGERICAYIVPKDPGRPPTKDEIIAFLKGRGVTKLYWPEHVETVERLPTTATGKVQKYVLRQMIAEKCRRPDFRLGA